MAAAAGSVDDGGFGPALAISVEPGDEDGEDAIGDVQAAQIPTRQRRARTARGTRTPPGGDAGTRGTSMAVSRPLRSARRRREEGRFGTSRAYPLDLSLGPNA
jgi:hypothetical protein